MKEVEAIFNILTWLNYIWPIVVTVGYILIKTKINKKIKYSILSVLFGYTVMVVSNVVGPIIMVYLISSNTMHAVSLGSIAHGWITTSINVLLTILIAFVPPIISSHFLAKKFS